MSKLLIRRKLLLAKIESTYGTDPTPSESVDAVLCQELTWSNEGLKMIERPSIRPSFAALRHVYAGRLVSINAKCEVKGSGAAGTAPEIGQLLRACGLGEAVSASTSVTYEPVSTSLESVTCYVYEDGKRIVVTGCRGSAAFEMTAAGIIIVTFTLTGHVAAQTDVALPTPTLDSTVPAPIVSGSFTIDSYSAVISSFSFDLSNSLAMPESINGADGYDEITITARDVNGSIDPLDELVATEDYLGNFTGGSAMALSIGSIGGIAGNIINIDMPAVSYRDASPGDRDGLASLELPFGAAESTGDDEVSIVFT